MSLDYTNADIRQVVEDVVGDIMSMPVIIDPGVGGTMTLRTSGQVPASDVPRLLDQALGPYGYGLAVVEQGVRVGRLTDLAGGVRSELQVIPVRYVNPAEVIEVIRPNVEESVRLKPAPGQRGIAITGPPGAVSSVRKLISLFDNDAMLHKSFAVYTLSQASPAAVERELGFLFNQNGHGTERVRFAALERLNGILVVADDPASLKQVRRAVAKLDIASEATTNIHVRPLQNRRAKEVADVLAQAYGAKIPGTKGSPQVAGEFGELSVGGNASKRSSLPVNLPGLPDQGPDTSALTNEAQDEAVLSAVSLGLSRPVRIQADTGQNALVIIAAPQDYRTIEAAIRRLDVKPRQVLIQAIVAEVRLSKRLKYGLDYLLSSRGLGGVPQGGLSYVFPGSDVNAVLHALSGLGDVKVVSAPRILALDNQTATIQVGDQVPILTRASQSTVSEGSPVVSDIELRDTGVILAVTPRIGAGGSVTLDTFQEVSTADKNTLTDLQSPIISVRRLQSTVSTVDGDTIAIGGLMQDSVEHANGGFPGLKSIPLLGPLFRNTEHTSYRTELLVLLNPRVVDSDADAWALTQELREKFESLAPDLGRRLMPRPRGGPSLSMRQQTAKDGYRRQTRDAGPGSSPHSAP
ncbi:MULTISPECIES: secretin N-terminal domain-containing protein [unclassified Sinorhizobium]|uniref:secretin N-terminal domain-containing protein n=1 Tax=unclassified Sinorhizobium TaxID=2613772 RepID=UPI0024C393EB|nr:MULTISPECIES: secretin N-terminal domain-containing protein [unclassified Sinorhizobium]MDK1378200.1 secretin N-terminal domain-containing protein [Sinorhizobium sp. 6-70]MDK1482726.1 secretin N-terminal domain-containing protein [Sinorhizobium sp. 6-117]